MAAARLDGGSAAVKKAQESLNVDNNPHVSKEILKANYNYVQVSHGMCLHSFQDRISPHLKLRVRLETFKGPQC